MASLSYVDAEDLTQETFLVAWRRLGQLRADEHFGAWLITIARNAAAKHAHRRRETRELDEEAPAQDGVSESGSPLSPTNGGEARLQELLMALPETYREVVALRFVEGLSGPEIATLTGRTPGSVRVHLHRAMTLLRDKLGRTAP